MRWLFGLLLLANLVLYLWTTTQPSVQSGEAASLPATVPGVPALKLVREQRAQTTVAEARDAKSPPAPAEAIAPPAEAAVPEDNTPPPVQRPAEQPVEPPSPPPPDTAEQSAAATPPPTPEPVADQCLRMGPFRAEGRARAAGRYLTERRVYTSLTTEGEARDARYIVYLPPAHSRAAALDRLRELQAKGIDSFILGGELKNAISLGVFSQRESALRLMDQMHGRGYPVELSSQERTTPTYWLELGPKNSGRLTDALAEAVAHRYPEARRWDRPCP